MQPELAWEAACTQLQMDLSKAAFDTYVREMVLVSYQEGHFIFGLLDPYARDWLQSRLTSILARMLTGIMNRPETVEFIVIPQEDSREEEQPEPGGCAEPEACDGPAPGERLVFREASRSLYNAIVQPEKVLSLPRYLLRFLPLVGSEIFLVQWAFRQMRYLRAGPSRQPRSFEATINDLLKWTTWSSRASFRRYMDQPELKWFGIEQIPQEGRAIDPVTGLAKQKPNRYRMQVDIPLTPMDADILRDILVGSGIREDPLKALHHALQLGEEILRPENPLPLPTDAQRARPPRPILVGDVVQAALENIQLDLETRKELTRLTDQLANKILRPGESIQTTWYFFQNWLAELGKADLGTFIVLMRGQCFYRFNETRDTFWVEGGYEEIARRLGMKREKTIASWLPNDLSLGRPRKASEELARITRDEQERRSHDCACVDPFVQRINQRPNAQGKYAFAFHVQVGSEPLTPQDQAVYDAALDITTRFEKAGMLAPLGEYIRDVLDQARDDLSIFETLTRTPFPFLSPSGAPISAFETLVQAAFPQLRLPSGAAFPFLRLFKVLKTLVPILNQVPEESTPLAEDQAGPDRAVEECFDLNQLLKLNRVHAALIARLLASERGLAWPFVSWLIYGNSPQGCGVKNPVSIALTKLGQEPGIGAGGAMDRLAMRRPKDLAVLLTRAIASGWPGDADWRQAMGGAETLKLRRLAGELGIEIP